MPSNVAYDPTAIQDADGRSIYIRERDNLGGALGTPDDFVRAMVKGSTEFLNEQPLESVYSSAKEQVGEKYGEHTVKFTIKVMQTDIDTENFFREDVKGKYYQIVDFAGISRYSNTLERNMQKVRFFALCKITPKYSEGTPDSRETECEVIVKPNPNAAAISLTSCGASVTGLTTADTENNLDTSATATNGWDGTDFSVASGKYYDIKEVKMAEDI